MKNIEYLKTLYAKSSKHSNYQILSKKLSILIGNDEIEVKSRYEYERLRYILKSIDVEDKAIIDIGGNTGFFSFELIDNGAGFVHYYEGNKNHADFVYHAAKELDIEKKIEITNDYLSFDNELKNSKYDIVLLLNVLHHIGDDYGNQKISIKKAKNSIIKQLNSLTNKTSILVFQLGFNWKGNRNLNLFEDGTKSEMIDFIKEGIRNQWEILKIGIAENINNKIDYYDLNENNIRRDDTLGEFLNRPIFIMKVLS